MKIFVTGGAGYIGSHTLLNLLRARHDVFVFDNFSNSSPEALRRVQRLANATFDHVEGDITDKAALSTALGDFKPDAVIHFAGLKAVGESSEKPLKYYQTNVEGSINLLDAMDKTGCDQLVFSSSATVYGDAQYLPLDEQHPLAPTNPYGRTKLFVEEIVRDWAASRESASAVLLRYFNPVGADASGMIGEDPTDIPNNLMPIVAQTAIGRRPKLSVFGNDYETRDGTGERDYIHVSDLAAAHLAAVEYAAEAKGCEVFNIGTGHGVTVMELLKAFEAEAGVKLDYDVAPRRAGDVAISVACADKAKEKLGWTAKLTVQDMCRSTWHWQTQNPNGYRDGQ